MARLATVKSPEPEIHQTTRGRSSPEAMASVKGTHARRYRSEIIQRAKRPRQTASLSLRMSHWPC
jgi:hypothetical protein